MKKIIGNIAILFLIGITILGYVKILGKTISNAGETSEENTNVENVKYSVYVKAQETNNYISERQTLVINIKVKNQGVLRDAKINIENPNFNIVETETSNQYIKGINYENSEIELNDIMNSNETTIELPIEFKKVDTFSEDYFSKEIPIKLEGIYIYGKDEKVEAERKIQLNWTEEPSTAFMQDIEKYIDLKNGKILVQQKICTAVQNNILPRKTETIKTKVPELEGTYPKEVVVISNGTKLKEEKINYNQQDGTLEIHNNKEQNEKGEIEWEGLVNEYNVVYMYETGKEAKPTTFELVTSIEYELYTKQEIKTNEETNQIETGIKGNVVEVTKQATNDLYKGYMYANTTDETTFEEKNTIKISKASEAEEIEISNPNEVFVDQDNNEYQATQSITYKSTMINKKDLEKIFGQKYEIKILNRENTQIATISNSTESDEEGNITINYDTELDYIKILTTHPETEGNITIQNTRAIKGNTGYTKEQLKTFNKLVLKSNVLNKGNYSENQTEIALEDTVIEAKMEINKTNLVAKKENEDVQILMTLLSNSNKYDLCKNPVIDITLPQELDMEVKNTELLNYEEEVKITKVEKIDREDGRKTIRLNLEGEQASFASGYAEGIKIALMGNVNVANVDETKEEKVELQYTNENSSNKQFVYEEPITIIAIPKEKTENNVEEVRYTENFVIDENQQKVSVELKERSGGEDLEKGKEVYEGQGVVYTAKIKNEGEENVNNVYVKAVNENAIYIDYVTKDRQYINGIHKGTMLEEIPDLKEKEFKIECIEPGETVEISYQIMVKEVEADTEKLTNELEIKSDEIETQIYKAEERKIKQGKMKIRIQADNPEESQILSKTQLHISIDLKNITDEKIEEAILEVPLEDKYTFDETRFIILSEKCEYIGYENNVLKLKIKNLEAQEELSIPIGVCASGFDKEIMEKTLTLCCYAYVGDEKYMSNEMYRKVKQGETTITAVQSTTCNKDIIETGDEFTINLTIKNVGYIDADISILDMVPDGLEIQKITINKDNEIKEIENYNNLITENLKIESGETVSININILVDTSKIEGETVSNYAQISGMLIDTKSNEITFKVKKEQKPTEPIIPTDPAEPTDPSDNPNIDDNNNTNNNKQDKEKFDLKLEKYISSVTIQNEKQNKKIQYKNQKLVKVEIPAKQIENTNIIIEYQIKVTNEGKVAGYANEIVDYIPKDLKFDAKSNPLWHQDNAGNIYCNDLENKIINPGESKTITVKLSKAMNGNNVGTTKNIAEISKATNEQSINDIDSTPKNKIEGEDDMGIAEIIISINTGKWIKYIILAITTIIIIAGGIYIINKKVL